VSLIEVEHTEIDRRVARNELNVLEREIAVRLSIAPPPFDRIIADGKKHVRRARPALLHFESHDRAEESSLGRRGLGHRQGARDERFAQIRARYEPELGPIAAAAIPTRPRALVRLHVLRYGRLPTRLASAGPHPYVEDLIGNVRPPGPQADLFRLSITLGPAHAPIHCARHFAIAGTSPHAPGTRDRSG